MKPFIDTNILLDLLLNRKHSEAAKSILQSIQEDLFEAVIADITVVNIDYIAKKQTTDIRHFLDYLNQIVTIVGADNSHISQAIKMKNKDLEDNLQLVLAKQSGCDLIIINDQTFSDSEIETTTSESFIRKFL